MSAEGKQAVKVLNRLHRICVAGEYGFQVASAHIDNRGLKVLLKQLGQQRGDYAEALRHEIQRLGGTVNERRSVPGMIHRGRIDIFAAMTIGRENREQVVLKEALRGENAALNAYERALQQALPAEVHTLVEHQYEGVRQAQSRVSALRGVTDKQVVVQLVESDEDVATAVNNLQSHGFATDNIERIELDPASLQAETRQSQLDETIFSGAIGGALWGTVMGAIAGGSVLLVPSLEPFWMNSFNLSWFIIALSGTLFGILLGALMGFLIGVGISEEDRHLFSDSVEKGSALILLETDQQQAKAARQIMRRAAGRMKAAPQPSV